MFWVNVITMYPSKLFKAQGIEEKERHGLQVSAWGSECTQGMIYIIDLRAFKKILHFCIEKRTELITTEDENIFNPINLNERANFNYTVLHQHIIFIF